MRFYIAGPITGHDMVNVIENFKTGSQLAYELNATEIVNPLELPHVHDKTWRSYMNECIAELVKCDAILMLDGWVNSKGAVIEHKIASLFDLKIYEFDNHINLLI